MKRNPIVVVGGTAAGPSAAAKAKRTNPSMEVMLFEATDTISYGICESPYAISGLIPDEAGLMSYSPERLHEDKGVVVKTQHLVERIRPETKSIVVRDLRRSTTEEYPFSKLILATGAIPKKLNLDGEEARNVFCLSSRADTLTIMKFIAEEHPKQAVIIGGGYIGMEMSEALRALMLDVTIVHRHRLPMAGLEQGTRESVLTKLEEHGIHFVSNAVVEGLQQADGRVRHVLTNRGTFESDIVILALGVLPNVKLARSANVRLGVTGAISTDTRQETNMSGIYAAGDCCELRNAVSGKPMYIPLATYASRAAWVAGENAAGGRATFKGAIRAIAVKVFDLEVAQVGLSSDEGRKAGFDVMTDTIVAYEKIALMPDSSKVTIHSIFDRASQRLIGANILGRAGAVLRANTLGVAIQQKLTVDDLARLDMIYSPPFAPLWDPILVAANSARKKINEK